MTLRTIETTLSIKIQSYFEFFSGLKTSFAVDRYLLGFKALRKRLDRLCQIWYIGRLELMLIRATEN